MERKPLDKINVSELCEEAGINRATFYRHYSIPRDVLTEMQSQVAEKLRSEFDVQTLFRSPMQYVESVCAYLYEHADLVKLFIRNNSEEAIIGMFDDFFFALLSENKALVKDAELDEDEFKLISAYMSGGGYFLLRRWLLDGIDKSPAEIARLVLAFTEPKV